jgi:excisionase family DNA binding protein
VFHLFQLCYPVLKMNQIPQPANSDIEAARRLSGLFSKHKGETTEVRIDGERVSLPEGIVSLMLEVLTQVAQGHNVSIVPKNMELSTAEAAEILNVSRPFVKRLIEEGKLPGHKVGTHYRIRLEDAVNYKKVQRRQSLEIMQRLDQEAQELGLE